MLDAAISRVQLLLRVLSAHGARGCRNAILTWKCKLPGHAIPIRKSDICSRSVIHHHVKNKQDVSLKQYVF